MTETWTFKGRQIPVKRTGAKPKIVGGVEFTCWHTGIQRYEWRSPDKRIRVKSNFRLSGYNTSVDGVPIPGADPRRSKDFRSIEKAMAAGVKAAAR